MTPPLHEMNGKTWDECKMFVLEELRRMNNTLDKVDEKVDNLGLKVAGIAAIVGIFVTIITNLIIRKM
jgi:hypothetical protein